MDIILYSYIEKQLVNYGQDNHLSRNEHIFYMELLDAVRQKNREVRDLYLLMGDDATHRFRNMYSYSYMQKFGFNDVCLNECGWIESNYFHSVETIEFRVAKDNAFCNEITTGCGNNGLWAYGLHYTTGRAGGAFGISVYGNAYTSKIEAFNAGIADLKKRLLEGKESAGTDTCGNFNVPYINSVLHKIDEIKIQRQAVQLSLFE